MDRDLLGKIIIRNELIKDFDGRNNIKKSQNMKIIGILINSEIHISHIVNRTLNYLKAVDMVIH